MNYRILRYLFLIVILSSCATTSSVKTKSSIEFETIGIVQDISDYGSIETALLGYFKFDDLPLNMKNKAESVGYKSGDRVPAKRYENGVIYILIPPQTDLYSKREKDWVRLN